MHPFDADCLSQLCFALVQGWPFLENWLRARWEMPWSR